jgi:hypothetical protein
MKSYQVYLMVLATGAAAAAMPGVTSSASISEATSIPDHAPHTADHAPAVNPGPFEDNVDVSQKCIHFTSENPDWHFANQPPWGSRTGTFGSLGGKLCVPTNNSAGGAMYIGPDANPGPGSTKLECYFPTSGQANCDASLVDGYSLSVTCKAGGKKIGGGVDLWKTGHNCADTSEKHSGICKNDKGYAKHQSDVTPFFQSGIEHGNNYCIWVNCSQDYYFPITADISCHVSGTKVT